MKKEKDDKKDHRVSITVIKAIFRFGVCRTPSGIVLES